MRFIRTTNAFVEFIEADNSGKILSSRGFQMGTVYFQIKNGKVTFYLNDTENPYQNDVWTTNIPLIIDDVEYATEDEVSNALHHIMNSNFQDQIDELSEDLAAESARAEASEAALDDAIDDERDRAVSAETHLSDAITALSGTVATYDDRIESVEDGVSAVTTSLNAEISRSTAKDAAHDTAISGLTTSVNNEIARALSAETSLHNEVLSEASRAQAAESGITANLNAEITNRQADVDAEEARAIAAESALTDAINAEETARETADGVISGAVDTVSSGLANEVQRAQNAESGLTNSINTVSGNVQSEIARATSMENALSGAIESLADSTTMGFDELDDAIDAEVARATAKDAAHDAEISGLTTSLQNEITRATGAENSLRNDLNAEVSARTTADAAQLQRITALEVGKADANSVYTKSESDTLLAQKADKANAVATAEYVSQNKTINFKNINGTVLSTIDATPFVVDGMVDDVRISGGNLVIVFNTDAGKQDIQIPLTDIFNPANYYDKTATDALLAEKLNTADFNTYSGVTKTAIDSKLNTSDFNTYSAATENVLANVYLKSETSGATQISSALDEKLDVTAYTPTDLSNYYTKDETSGKTEIANALAEKLAVSDFNTYSGNVATALSEKASQSTVDTLSGVVTSHTSDSTIHLTSGDVQNQISGKANSDDVYLKSETSGATELATAFAAKQDQLIAGENITISGNVISSEGGGCEVEETVVYDRLTIPYNDYGGDNKVTYTIIDYLGDKTTATNIGIDFEIGGTSDYYSGWIHFDYVNHSANTDSSISDYVTAEYISDIQDFKVSIASAYQSTWWIKRIGNLQFDTNALIPFYKINSGSPCTVITTDVVGLVTKVKDKAYGAVSSCDLLSSEDDIHINVYHINGINEIYKIKLEELDGSNNKLKPNIQVPLGVSGWTEVGLSDNTCQLSDNKVKGFTTFRISGDTTQLPNWNLQIAVGYNNNWAWDSVNWDINTFVLTRSWDVFSAATAVWDSNTGYLTVSYPQTVIVDGEERQTEFYHINSNQCQYGYAITKFEYYAELQQPLKPYVHQLRTDVNTISGTVATKQNQLTAGTGISIQNDVISVTASSPSVDAYTKAESDAKFATITNFNSHSGDTTAHVTAAEKSTWNNKSDFSGNYNDLSNKPTIPTSASQLTNDAGYITSNDITGKTDVTAFTSHTADTTVHVTASEKQTWNNKPNVWSGSEQQWAQISGGTLDNNTIYLIY